MQQASEHVDQAYFSLNPPRPMSPALVLHLLAEHLMERPLRTFLHPLFVVGVAVFVAVLALRLPTALLALPLGVVVGWLLISGQRVWHRVWEELQLLRHGVVLRAHILKLRPHRTLAGDLDGALLDCAIAVTTRRTYIGSIWLADGVEARRLQQQRYMRVLCLPYAPGSWRVLEPIHSDVRYDRVGPAISIPEDD